MFRKIISGGQTGADRAALDTAIKFNIAHGGWLPKGRLTEDGPLSNRYNLKEMPEPDYPKRTRQNIIDSDGTVIISRGQLTGGSLLTKNLAVDLNKFYCHIDLSKVEEFEAAMILNSFITDNKIEILNVAGPRMSSMPGIYQDVKTVLEILLYLRFLEKEEEKFKEAGFHKLKDPEENFPKTVKMAVDIISRDLSLKQKTFIARMDDRKIGALYFSFLDYVRKKVGFDSQNKDLFESCSELVFHDFPDIEELVMEIIKALKQFLEKEYSLKVVK